MAPAALEKARHVGRVFRVHECIVMLTSTPRACLNAGYSPDFGDLMTTLELRFD